MDLGTYDEPPFEHFLQPRTRSYKPRLDRSGFADKSAEKLAQRQKILEEEQALQREILGYIHNGTLDLAALDRPVSKRAYGIVLLGGDCQSQPRPQGQTQYGQRYKLQKRGIGIAY